MRGNCLRQLFWNDCAPRVRGNVGGSGGRHHSDGSDKEGEEDVTHAADGDHGEPLLWFSSTDRAMTRDPAIDDDLIGLEILLKLD